MPPPDLEAILDRLYAAPLGEFVALRNEAAKELRKAGDRETADQVKALKKPSAAAWAVNQLHYRGDEGLAALTEATATVVQAHTGPGTGLREAVQERRRRVDQLVDAARDVLQEAGMGTTRDQMRRVMGTIEGATALDSEHRPGRLTIDLEAPGFGALSGLSLSVPPDGGAGKTARAASRSTGTGARTGSARKPPRRPAPPRPTRAEPDDDARADALRAELEIEESRHERAEREVTRADTAHLAAKKRIERAQAGIEELEERLARARRGLEDARIEADERAKELEEAKEARERAAERLRAARERVDSALGPG